MELKQLHFFVICAQTGSFSKAANLLCTAQSNVSKVIKSLEDELDMELFSRKQYGIILTEDGKHLYDYACDSLESVQKIKDFAGQKNKEELRISCNPSSWMACAFRDYFNQYERRDVSYYIMTASTNDIIRRLASDIDQLGYVYIMEDQLPVLKDSFARNHITFTRLKKTKAVLYFGNREAKKDYLQHKEDDELALVQGFEDEFTLRSSWDDRARIDGELKSRVAVTTNSDYVMSEMLRYTRLGNISGDYLSKNGTRRTSMTVPLYGGKEEVIFGCLLRNDRNLGKVQKDYFNFVKKRIEAED